MSKDYALVYSPEALDDLRAIFEYVANVAAAPQAARQLVVRIQSAIRLLSTMPMRHQLLESDLGQSLGIRKMSVGNYVVLYRVVESVSEVQVLRIAYGGRNLLELLISNN